MPLRRLVLRVQLPEITADKAVVAVHAVDPPLQECNCAPTRISIDLSVQKLPPLMLRSSSCHVLQTGVMFPDPVMMYLQEWTIDVETFFAKPTGGVR